MEIDPDARCEHCVGQCEPSRRQAQLALHAIDVLGIDGTGNGCFDPKDKLRAEAIGRATQQIGALGCTFTTPTLINQIQQY